MNTELFFQLAVLTAGLICLWKGADLLVIGAVSVAKRLKISEFIIGFTVLALGTSLPELIVTIIALIEGQGDMIYGNVVGSNIANSTLILGAGAVIAPIGALAQYRTHAGINVCISLLAVLGCWAMILSPSTHLAVGLSLLLFFAFSLWKLSNSRSDQTEESNALSHPAHMLAHILIGMGLLYLGGEWLIQSATQLAILWKLPEVVIGILVLAIGTSLPELITVIISARNRSAELVMGNILGSNIFNITLVLGLSLSLEALAPPLSILEDLYILSGISIFLFYIILMKSRSDTPKAMSDIRRFQGILLLGLYFCYIAFTLGR